MKESPYSGLPEPINTARKIEELMKIIGKPEGYNQHYFNKIIKIAPKYLHPDIVQAATVLNSRFHNTSYLFDMLASYLLHHLENTNTFFVQPQLSDSSGIFRNVENIFSIYAHGKGSPETIYYDPKYSESYYIEAAMKFAYTYGENLSSRISSSGSELDPDQRILSKLTPTTDKESIKVLIKNGSWLNC